MYVISDIPMMCVVCKDLSMFVSYELLGHHQCVIICMHDSCTHDLSYMYIYMYNV